MLPLLLATAFAAQPLLLPGAPLAAGEPGQVDLWVPGLAPEAKVKAQAAGARVHRVERLADGRLRLHLVPTAPGELELALSIRGPAGKEEGQLTVPVAAALTGGLRVEPAQERFLLGSDKALELTVRPAIDSDRPVGVRQLVVHPSLGRMDAPRSTTDGWSLSWTPPKALDAPSYAILAVADAAAPSAMPGWAAVPVAVQTTLRLEAEPQAACTLTAGSDRVEATADAAGSVVFSFPLHPALARGDLACQVGERSWHRAVPLPAGQDPWLGWLPLPPRVPAGAQVPVQLAVVEDDGAPLLKGTAPRVQASAGELGELSLVGPGLAAGTWTAPTQPGTVRLTARLREKEVQATVEVVAGLPETTVVAEPSLLAEGVRDVRLAVAGAVPGAVHGEGATLRGRIGQSDGGASATVRLASGRDSAAITVVPDLPTSGLVPASIVGWADTPTVPAGHREPVGLTLAVLDDLGLPVPGVELALAASGGAVQPSVRTDRQGLARATLSPQADGVATVQARAAGLAGAVPVLVGLAEGPLVDAPGGGPSRVVALRERLRAAVPTVVVARVGATAGSPAAPAHATALPPPAPASASTAAQAAGQALAEQDAAVARARPPREQRDRPWARFAVVAATVPHSYRQTSSGDEGLPERLDADQGDLFRGKIAGAPAVHARAVVLPDGLPLGFDARLQGRYEGYVVNDASFTRLDLQGAAGLRLPLADSGLLSPYLLAQGEYYRVPLFTYENFREENPDKATGARMLTTGVIGARLGGGIGISLQELLIEVEATETLAPWPVHTRAEIGAEYPVSPLVGLRAGLELGFRSMTFDLDQDEARVTDQQHALSVGLLFLLR